MIRYIIEPTEINNLTEFDAMTIKRHTNGVIIDDTTTYATWTGRTIPADYNDSALYIKRAVAAIVDSTATNTLITNDGLIAVFREANVLEVIDIFENDATTYQELLPLGYAELASYDEIINPANKRLFIVRYNNDGSVLYTKNTLEFIDIDDYHFSSQFDYALPTDEYGFYITNSTDWTNIYEETSDFQFLKKSFFKIEGTGTITVALKAEDSTIDLDTTTVPGTCILRYLDIDTTDSADDDNDLFINFIISSDSDYGYIAVY